MTGESKAPEGAEDGVPSGPSEAGAVETAETTEAAEGGGPDAAGPKEYESGGLRLALLVGLIAYVGVAHGWSWVVIILGLVVMIFLHELGHFVTARWTGMKATEFFIGFGPRIWSFRRGETEYGLKAIPAGAYVRIIGMTNVEEVPPEDEARTYRQQSFPRRLLVVSAGSLMHLFQALVIAVVLLVFVGTPGGALMSEPELTDRQEQEWFIGGVTRGSGAYEAGLEPGDRIVMWDGEPIRRFDDISRSVGSADVGDEVLLTVDRDGEQLDLEVVLGDGCDIDPQEAGIAASPPPGPFLGVQKSWPDRTLGVVEGTTEATAETGRALWGATQALGSFVSPSGLSNFFDSAFSGGSQAPSEPTTTDACGNGTATAGAGGSSSGSDDDGRVMSILGAVRIGNTLGSESVAGLLVFFFVINIFIGLVNMAPLLPLDGGHAVVAFYERLRSRNGRRYYADANKLMPMAYAGLTVLLVIGLTALYLDIVDPVRL